MAKCPAHDDRTASLSINRTQDGTVLFTCFAACDKPKIAEAVGATMADFFEVPAGADGYYSNVSTSYPPTAQHIADATEYIEAANQRFKDSAAASYVDRFGIDIEHAHYLGLGYDDGTIACPWLTPAYKGVPRLVVPFVGFDGIIRGWQGRALSEHHVRWCGPRNPEGHSWSTFGCFLEEGDPHTVVICEGPGDGLTCVGTGTRTVFIRGAGLGRNIKALDALAAGVHNQKAIIAGDADSAGVDFTLNVAGHLAEAGVQTYTLSIPVGGDITDWRKNDPTTFNHDFHVALRNAERIDSNYVPPETTTDYDFIEEFEDDHFFHNDEGNAERLAKILSGAALWCPELGYLILDGGSCWVPDTHRLIEQAMAFTTLNMVATGNTIMMAACDGEDADGQPIVINEQEFNRGLALERFAKRSMDSPKFETAIRRAGPKIPVRFEDLDTHDDILLFNNGPVDLKSGELLPHDPSLLMTNKIEFDYPETEVDCPNFRKFVLEFCNGNEELYEWLHTYLGYSITGSTREQIVGVFHGSGANGKSTLLNVIQRLFKAISKPASFSTFERKGAGSSTADLAALRGARLVFVNEGERGVAMSESRIKMMSGGDPVDCRHLYKEQMSYYPKYQITLVTNHKPVFKGQDEGLWRRLQLFPCDLYVAPEDRDIYLEEKLLEESEAIIRWVVEGAVKWYREGLNPPEILRDARKNYKEGQDALAGFLDFVVVADPEGEIKGSELYESYRDWASEEGLKDYWARQTLYSAIEERMPDVRKVKRNYGQHFFGLRLAKSDDVVVTAPISKLSIISSSSSSLEEVKKTESSPPLCHSDEEDGQ